MTLEVSFYGLKVIGTLLIAPVANFAVQAEVLTAAFRINQIGEDGSNKMTKMEKLSYTRASLCDKKARRYKKILSQADYSFNKQLDLVNFVKRQRQAHLSNLVMFSKYQKDVVKRLSALFLRELPT